MSYTNYERVNYSPPYSRLVGLKPVKVIAIASGKGGVGKSCISANLAVSLAQKNKKVLLLDADLAFPNLDVMLGLESSYNLSHVAQGICPLNDILLPGPEGIFVIPGATCSDYMTQLTPQQYAGIIDAFNELTQQWDFLIIDTSAGISEGGLNFTRSSQEIILVVCDEPASLADTYTFMKLMNKRYRWQKFHILVNMTFNSEEGFAVFHKMSQLGAQFLNVSLNYLGNIPFDLNIKKTIRKQESIVSVCPLSRSTLAFKKIAHSINEWPLNLMAGENTSFFVERFLVE